MTHNNLAILSMLLVLTPRTMAQEPKNVQEALAQIMRVEGKVKYADGGGAVIAIDI